MISLLKNIGGNYANVYNLLWNASKKKMDCCIGRKMDSWICYKTSKMFIVESKKKKTKGYL